MQFILSEREYIEKIMETNEVPSDLSKKYLINLMVKYFYQVEKKDKKETLSIVKEKMLGFNFDITEYQEYQWVDYMESTFESVKSNNRALRDIMKVPLYESEQKKIEALELDKEKKVLFAMYIIARASNGNGWINLEQKEIFKLANVSTTISNQVDMLHKFYKLGLIQLSRKINNTSIMVELADESEEVVFEVTNLDKLGNQYLGKFKEGYKQCENSKCGKVFKKRGNKSMYCTKCSNEKELERYKKYNEKR